MKRIAFLSILLLAATLAGPLSGCGQEADLQMYFVPSNEVEAVTTSADAIKMELEEKMGLTVANRIPTRYAAVVEAFGSGDADLAFMPPFAYAMAHDMYGASAGLITVRHGSQTYQAEIIVRADSGITCIADLEGKTWAFSDHNSTSGYIVPQRMLAAEGVTHGEELATGGHPQTVDAVYSGRADFGTCFYSPPDEEGNIKDARMYLEDQVPTIADEVIILERSMPIPNDCVCFRRDLNPEVRQQICDILAAYSQTEVGKEALGELASIDELRPIDDAFYAQFREWAAETEQRDE